jgi:hypothetical protein
MPEVLNPPVAPVYKTPRRHIPEHVNLNIQCCQNLIAHGPWLLPSLCLPIHNSAPSLTSPPLALTLVNFSFLCVVPHGAPQYTDGINR